MSTRKSVTSQAKAPAEMTFLTPATNKRKSRMVSIRVDEDLLLQFHAAAEKAGEAGYDLSMTTLVHSAIRMALDEVAKVHVAPALL